MINWVGLKQIWKCMLIPTCLSHDLQILQFRHTISSKEKVAAIQLYWKIHMISGLISPKPTQGQCPEKLVYYNNLSKFKRSWLNELFIAIYQSSFLLIGLKMNCFPHKLECIFTRCLLLNLSGDLNIRNRNCELKIEQ